MNKGVISMRIGPIRKAVVAGLVAGTGSLAVAGVDNRITLGEALVALAAAIAAVGAVYRVKNADA